MINFTEKIIFEFLIKDVHCRDVIHINDTEKRCEFVQTTESCAYDGILFSFIEMAYCRLNDSLILNSIILFGILFILFITISLVADNFLCPSLLTISNTLKLPNNIAGVTLLAFGNGAPDIFASIGGISHAKPHLIFASLFGAGTFVTTIVIGCIILSGEFTMNKRPLVRDIIFYIGATFLTWVFIYGRTFKIGNSIALICYYLVYILTIFACRYIYLQIRQTKRQRRQQQLQQQTLLDSELPLTEIRVSISSNVDNHQISSTTSFIMNLNRKNSLSSSNSNLNQDDLSEDEIILPRFFRNGSIMRSTNSRRKSESKHFAHHHWSNTIYSVSKALETDEDDFDSQTYLNQNEREDYNDNSTKYLAQFSINEMMSETKNFLLHICPIDMLEWKEYPFYKKLLELIKAGPYFLLILCIPVVDLESVNDDWCRLLFCINIVIAPQIVIFLKQVEYDINDQFPLWALLLIISFVLIILLFLTTDKNRSPFYHRVFALIGFIVSIIFIQTIANEIINILKTFALLFNLSDSILGLTILAWGNSCGDLISNLSMARHGYHSMAIAACFGGPLFNLLIGLGIPYLMLFIKNDNFSNTINIHYNHMITLPYATLTASLAISLLIFVLGNFRSHRLHGYILITIYMIYIILAFLMEFHVI
ncbi:mitochondrial sodium/calcium exchanger protein-like [Dermatophagoides pteronyssinus]|uniref:mitochondrial sodium/calcium exchanger protein-like n=1 Tax=Dermatophagoides pteronyssinus TaxID=6956 RepID=UPI003F67AE3D